MKNLRNEKHPFKQKLSLKVFKYWQFEEKQNY